MNVHVSRGIIALHCIFACVGWLQQIIVPVILILSYAGTQEKDSREPSVASKESDELGN